MRTQRVVLHRDARVVQETPEGVRLESAARLRPGHRVELVDEEGSAGTAGVRNALVCSWAIQRLGSNGPVYGGFCRWV